MPSENNPCSGEAEVTRLLLTSSFLTRSQKCHTASFMDCVPTPGEVSDTVRGEGETLERVALQTLKAVCMPASESSKVAV